MRRLLLSTLLLLLGALLSAGPARAETLADMASKLETWKKRVQLWLDLAQRDPDLDLIDRYKRQQAEDFRRKGHVEAAELVEVMTNSGKHKDPSKPMDVRTKAFEVLAAAASATFDPDLEGPKRKGQTSKRGAFARDQLIPWLKDKDGDRDSRDWVRQILEKWFNAAASRNYSDLQNYNIDDPKTWPAAAKAWGELAREN